MQVNMQQNICNKVGIDAEGIEDTGFPIKAFPQKIQSILIEWAQVNNYKVEYAAAAMLSAVSTALGGTRRIHIKGDWCTHAALYIILVGRPGLGKTPPLEAALKPLKEYDTVRYQQYVEDMELYKQSQSKGKGGEEESDGSEKPVLRKTIVSDFTPEALVIAHDKNPRSLLIHVDEILGMFNSANRYNNGQLIELMLTSWTGGAIDVTRVSSQSIHIEHPNINIIGTTQTARVKELLQKGYKDNGLLDRFLFVIPKEQDIPKWELPSADEKSVDNASADSKQRKTNILKASQQWKDIINKVLDIDYIIDEENGEPFAPDLMMSHDAKVMFYEWRNAIIAEQNSKSTTDDLMDDMETRFAKQDTNVARFALLIQVMRFACGDSHLQFIDADSIRSAIMLSDYFEDCYQRMSLSVAEAASSTPAKEMLDYLGGEFTTKDAEAYGESAKISRRTIMNYLKELVDNGLIRKLKKGNYVKVEYVKPANDSRK